MPLMIWLTRGFCAGDPEIAGRGALCRLRRYCGLWWACRGTELRVVRDVAGEREVLLTVRGAGRVSASVEGKSTKSELSWTILNVWGVAGVGSRGDWG